MHKIEVKLVGSNTPECVISGMEKPYKNENADINLVKKVCLSEKLQERHGSVMEHVVFTFEVLGSSRLELQEHMRHRMASPTVESTRYVLDKMMKDVEAAGGPLFVKSSDYFVMPDLTNNNWGEDTREEFIDDYVGYCDAQIANIYTMYTRYATCKKDNDTLKYFLPENLRTNFTWTINLRSLINFLQLRTNPGAHFEIRHIAGLVIEALKDHWIWPVIEEGLIELTA